MTPQAYTAALATLGLSQADAACAWLGVTRSTHYRYVNQGPIPQVARWLEQTVRLRVEYPDVADALGLPG